MSAPVRRAAAPLRAVAGALSLLLVAGVLGLLVPAAARADSAPLSPATPATVTADALPTVQVDGVVWSQVTVGDTVYVAGRFGTARPAGAAPGTQLTTRNNLLAYDIRTGALVTSFAPDLNGQALTVAASPDGRRVYVGGDFTRANGQVRNRVAAYDTATGALVPNWAPSVAGQVRALAVTGSTVYLGGAISAVGSASRTRLAAVTTATGALLPWAPVPGTGPTTGNRLPLFDAAGKPRPGTLDTAANARTSNDVLALAVTGGGTQVVAAGRFYSMNGAVATGVAALDPVSGANRPFAVNQQITNQGINSAVYSLSTDGTTVYGTAYDYYGPGNLESAFAATADGGRLVWASSCRGDTYNSFPMGGALYLASHAHDCANVIDGFPEQSPQVHRHATAFSRAAAGRGLGFTVSNANFAFAPAPELLAWHPTLTIGSVTGQDQAAWSITGNGTYLSYGGEFPKANGTAQQGLVRFAVTGTAPGKMAPSSGGLTPSLVSTAPGTVRVSWTESVDPDNENLTYRIYRDGGTTPVAEVTSPSTWYDLSRMAWTDRDVPAGAHTYRIGVVDPQGNRNTGPTASVTVAAGTTVTRSWAELVRADGASDLWSFGETSGTGWNAVGGSDLTVNAGVTRGTAGAIAQDGNTAATFSGSTSGFAASQTRILGPQTFSLEAWFSTTTRAGGKIVGFGSSATGLSGNHDRAVYMDTAGRLNFGLWPGAQRVVTSSTAYNDGRWHHVVATVGATGMTLSVDGRQVGARTDTTGGQPGYGYWRIGGDSTWSGAQFFAGRIDEVAVYPVVLDAARVADHFRAGSTGAVVNLAPTASFTSAATDLTAAFDASASADADGTVAGYAWRFGDGATGTGVTASHAYAAAGTYPVTLTVTDDEGATGTRTASVTVTAPPPNVLPTAAFTAAAAGRTVTLDASASADADGAVTGWSWAFGDGTRDSGRQVTHDYAADGEYAVTLTVTDDDGATATATQRVTVRSGVLVADAFDREVTGGLGAAATGGAWSSSAGPTRQSVTGGEAVLSTTAGTNTGAYLGAVAATSADVRTTVTLSSVPTGTGASVYVVGRRVAAGQEYRARLRFLTDGSVRLAVVRLAGGAEALVGAEVAVPGLTYTAGTPLAVRLVVDGTGTTTLAASVWAAGTAEPATPLVERTDATASLQAPGAVGLLGYLSGGATTPVAVRFAELTAAPAGAAGAPGGPAANAAPEARVSATTTGLTAALDGSGSTDTDGTVAGWAWEFGDGTAGTGARVEHAYAAAGSYTVRLTVTDDAGATATTTTTVEVTAPAGPVAPQPFAEDTFARDVAGGLGTADLGGAWTVSAGAARQSVSAGTATLALTAGTNTGSYLGGVAQTRADVRTTVTLGAAPTGGGASVYVVGRRVGADQEYRARLRLLADGTVRVAVTRLAGTGAETIVGTEVVVPGLSSTAGTPVAVRFVVDGTGTTALAATVWAAGQAEPATPTLTRTDTTASLQAPGAVGLSGYLSGSATTPVPVRVTAFSARPVA
ncbi:PKD domain-containing protein [Geodermatophilus nigrescens]|uniref:PKD repeat-containing protein n=1 Tax=Geodermatophilus nigrescens TaxID=1070870 RepID=A0A1M5E394_9ACTN|nr:PKD domain-containing protein [Geodermatophilus nigrescens]SHF73640.1 PKD repeat-containing protein [Geodermatophilus nigrescens]